MTAAEIILLGLALSMDAFAVGLTNGMSEPDMKRGKMLLVALFYGGFQCMMPLVGYYAGSAFVALIEKIAPWLSFALLAFLGGKMIFDSIREQENALKPLSGGRAIVKRKTLTIGVLIAQAFATSIDALAAGVSLLAEETKGGLPLPAVGCCAVIGIVTFLCSTVAVNLGKTAGNSLADKAETAGGIVLIAIGLKLLLDGF